MKPNYESLEEFFSELEYHGGWPVYAERFLCNSPQGRAIELSCYDKLLAEECRLTHELADYREKRKWMFQWHDRLQRAGR